MANILTELEAAAVLRCDSDDEELLNLLPIVDAYVKNATGRDWTADSTIHPSAKAAARMLLVMWHENPGMIGVEGSLGHGMRATLTQLEALAGRYFTFRGGYGAGAVSLPGAMAGDTVSTLVGKVGVTGDQSTNFETVITYDDEIQQESADDLSDNWYQAYLIPASEM